MISVGADKPPADINQLESQKKRINHLQNHQVSPSTMQEAMGRVIRGAEMTMQNAILLQHEFARVISTNARPYAGHEVQQWGDKRMNLEP